jgi:uncharacterized protein YkvS
MDIRLVALIILAYVILAYYFVKKRGKIVIERGSVGNVIDPGDIIAMPRELTINIVEDVRVEYELYSDITIRISDLLSGNYKIPPRFLKENKDVISVSEEKGIVEKVKEQSIKEVDMSMYEKLEDEEVEKEASS